MIHACDFIEFKVLSGVRSELRRPEIEEASEIRHEGDHAHG
jgi:hypothetical protein